MTSDLGQETVTYLFDAMQVDPEWSVREDRGGVWWPGELAQRIWADPPRSGPTGPVFDVRAETDVIRNISPSERLTHMISVLNTHASLSALVYDEDQRLLRYACSMVIHQQNIDWARRLLSLAIAIQAVDAIIKLEISDVLGGVPAVSAHPVSGLRTSRDDMVNVVSQSIAPHGSGASSPFSAADFASIEELDPNPSVLTTADESGLTAEFPFLGPRSGAQASLEGRPPETALLQITRNDRHPQLGSGCLVRLTLPVGADTEGMALELNRREATLASDCHFLGAWCVGPIGLTFVTFLPAIAHRPGLLANIFMSSAIRTRWAREQILGRLS